MILLNDRDFRFYKLFIAKCIWKIAKTDLINQRQVFVEEYVRSGDHLEAAKMAGYKDTHTLRNQACKLRRECAEEITEELHRNFAEITPRALNILTDLAENAES